MQSRSQTKIVATIGPSTWDEGVLADMIENGMQMARINASFADEKELAEVSAKIRKLSSKVAVLLDTMGHKIRTAGFDGERRLKEGSTVVLMADSGKPTTKDTIALTYPNLHEFVTPGNKVMIDDGNIQLEVVAIGSKEVECKVLVGGVVKKSKTVNIPGVHLDFEKLTEKDRKDIRYAVENNFDYISASYIRNMEDVLAIREEMGETNTRLIAKIENQEGVENFDKILGVVDGIMIARGDLGVELPLEQVPILQKQFILKARQTGKLSIVATQMLESMRENPRPTRAEVSDVANAVMDGTDAVMLSAETSTGKYPVEAVSQMQRVATEAERVLKSQPVMGRTKASEDTDTICRHVYNMAHDLGLKGVVVISQTGKTVISLARHRMSLPIWNVSPNPQLMRQLNLYRGVNGVYIKDLKNDRDEVVMAAFEVVYAQGSLELSDKVAIISGSSITNKSTNSIVEISTVKDILNR